MASIQLTVKQFAAICTGSMTPPWTLKIQPKQSTKSVSLKSLIAQVSESEVILFADLRNGTIFENYPGVISDYVQAYIFNRTCLSADDIKNLITALTQNNLSLVYVSPTMQTVGIRGTIGNFNAMHLYGLGEITSVGDKLTSSASTGEAGQTQDQVFWQGGAVAVAGGAIGAVGSSALRGWLFAKASSRVVTESVYELVNTTGNSVAGTAAGG